ncbi:hypothetical protein E2N92_02815 [Methanofollis formosanus]|uniref:Uncharacterized protein n=1 Tax=Methanofollis formosanus TaxID=299308 RepID=A0A8G1EG10_9EURY|nr:hypothetical protein [Methanofollis formosanus]QYZ78437.1 hypothetical protein E2N92_02815 [Methanofollis formosanus]
MGLKIGQKMAYSGLFASFILSGFLIARIKTVLVTFWQIKPDFFDFRRAGPCRIEIWTRIGRRTDPCPERPSLDLDARIGAWIGLISLWPEIFGFYQNIGFFSHILSF